MGENTKYKYNIPASLTDDHISRIHSVRNRMSLLLDDDVRESYPHEMNTLIEDSMKDMQEIINASIIED